MIQENQPDGDGIETEERKVPSISDTDTKVNEANFADDTPIEEPIDAGRIRERE